MKHKLFEIVLVYVVLAMFTGACGAINVPAAAPLVDGEVFNLYRGTAVWLATSEDIMIHTFYNAATGVTIHARAIADGWAIACERSQYCDDLVGYLVNVNTYNAFKAWALGSGFVEVARNIPPLPGVAMPTILILPAIMVQPGVLEQMTMQAAGFGVYDDAGNYVGSRFHFTPDASDGFVNESAQWEVQTVKLP